MFTAAMIRTASLSAWLALAALASSRAAAELPEHLVADGFGPINADFDFENPIDPPSTFDLRFGDTVAMRNGVAFVSIPFSHRGRVAALNQTTNGWQRVQTLNAPIPDAGFGRTITFRDGLVIVGDQTAAYVYKRNSSGVWTLRQTLRPPASDGVALFPVALKYEAGTLLASAFRDTLPGLVYVFELGTDGRFVRRASLRALDARPTFASIASEGIVFTYTRDGSAVLAKGIASAHFQSNSGNISMALANNWLLVGHLGDERCFLGCPGAATLYDVNRFRQ